MGFIQKWIHSLNVPVDEATGAIRVTGLQLEGDIDIGDVNILNASDETINPATQEGLASILAKLSADPATQATLAAVLAKLSSDPATQTTLVAVLSALGSPAQANEADSAADLVITALGSPAQAAEADAAADLIITALGSPAQAGEFATALGSPAQAGEADSAADLMITALGSPAQAAEADAAADLVVTALGSPAQAGEAATAADTIMGGEGGQSLAGVVTALGSPMQTGEVDVSGLALETGGVLADILTALGVTGTLGQTGEAATAASDIIEGIVGAGANTATLYDIATALGSPLSINFDVNGTPMVASGDTGGAGTFSVLKTSLYAKPPAYPGTECGPLSASIIDALRSTLALNITEHLLAPVMGDYHAATCSQVEFGGFTGGVPGYAKNTELCAREYSLGTSYPLSCTSTDDMIHFDGRVALNVVPLTYDPYFVTHQALNTYGGAVAVAGSDGVTFTPLLCDTVGQLLLGDGLGGNGLAGDGKNFLKSIRDGWVAAHDFDQLLAPGNGTAFIVGFAAKDHGFGVTVGTINTNVIVKFQGSMDGALFFDLLTTDVTTGVAAVQHTITGNGTSQYILNGNALLYDVRPVFVSEAGGTDATVDVHSQHVR